MLPARRAPSLVGPTRLRALAEEHDVDEVGWDAPSLPLLWRYNQHYFDDLSAADAESRRHWHCALIDRWLADNPPGRGTAFAPYPTSLRMVNWIKAFLGDLEPAPVWLDSLALQARWLSRHLEWHLLGNHLFANAKALVYAGLFFDGPQAQAWLQRGLSILQRELPEQVLRDGGHFERSPMYHALALEDVLDLMNAIRTLGPADPRVKSMQVQLAVVAASMLHWLRCMTAPDGTPTRFNDSADGIAPVLPELERYAAALGVTAPMPAAEGVNQLRDSGYTVMARAGAQAWLDTAPIGPDYLPGHAHADTLSYELYVHGKALVVNRGTSVYGDGARRQTERGTAAHSTLQLDDLDSSEVWSGFRVGRRARPGPVEAKGWEVSCSHDGYSHLPGHPIHERSWSLGIGGLVVHDRVVSNRAREGVVRHHLAPGLQLQPDLLPGRWLVRDAAGHQVALAEVATGSVEVEPWDHALAFGKLAQAQTLRVQTSGGQAVLRWHWKR